MRGVPRAAAAVLFGALITAYGTVAWREAETHALAAAGAEGQALLGAVAAGVEANLAASRTVQTLLGDRLEREAREVIARLGDAAGMEEAVLREEVARRRLAGAALLDPDLGIAAEADAGSDAPAEAGDPFGARRLAKFAMTALTGRIRAANDGRTVVAGFSNGPFADAHEFNVAVRDDTLPGFVVLRADAAPYERFQREAGIGRVLRDCARAPAVAFLALQGADGTCLASNDESLVGAVLPDAPTEPGWRTDRHGRRTLDVALPVAWEGGPSGHLRVALDAAPVEDVIARTRTQLGVATGAALFAGLAGLLALAGVERRHRAAEAALREELGRRERFASLGRLAAGVAHEVRGPLNALSLSSQLLARDAARGAGPAQVTEHTTAIRTAVTRIDQVVADFLALGRSAAPPERVAVDLAAVVADAAETEGGPLRTEPPPSPVVVRGDRRVLARAVANLVRNARQFAPPESVSVAWAVDDGDAIVDVDDGGPGVPEADRATVFEPFRTTRADGTGLGLALAREAAEIHGGSIEVLRAPAGGARFRVRLPLDAGARGAA